MERTVERLTNDNQKLNYQQRPMYAYITAQYADFQKLNQEVARLQACQTDFPAQLTLSDIVNTTLPFNGMEGTLYEL